MSIISSTKPIRGDLSPELQDILCRNGMQAHIIRQGDAFQLAVQGHDSPLLTYAISANQMRALTSWGNNHANKTAYNTFANIISKDFDLPRNFVHARNANGRVVMGLHGYRIGAGEYGRPMHVGPHGIVTDMRRGLFGASFLGWTPRHQSGFHGRRVGGAYFYQGAPMVAVRPDDRLKPGELQSGAYGFYYKGLQTVGQQPKEDVLADLQTMIEPVESRPRPQEPAVAYKDAITSKVYFSNEKWQSVLASHGIVIDADKKTMTIQSSATQNDFLYDLTDEELKQLTSNSIKDVSVEKRLDVLNNVIQDDFKDKVTMDMLNSKNLISIGLKPDVEQRLQEEISRQETVIEAINHEEINDPVLVEREEARQGIARVDGNALYDMNDSKGWYREGNHGREVQVDDIHVEPIRDEQGEPVKDKKGNMQYRMTAVINGESISHEITQKQYDKFMAIDDYHRMKLFSHIFNEVDMKNVPGNHTGIGTQIGAALLAGLAVTHELAHDHHHPTPAIFEERFGGHVYVKPGIDTPRDIASRAFEAGLNAGEHGVGLGR